MRLAWLTDIHLDFVSEPDRRQFIQTIRESRADALLIGGDIAEADSFAGHLARLAAATRCPVYFVLGNHDYFGGSIASVRAEASRLTNDAALNLTWLPDAGVVTFANDANVCDTVLIGHGGWGDGRAGKFFESGIVLHDYLKIAELVAAFGNPDTFNGRLPHSLFECLNTLGDEVADSLKTSLPRAFEQANRVILLMHVPPFLEACWYKGKPSDDNWAPHFVCQAAGEYLREQMAQHPDKQLTVLCGHTHGAGTADILPNLHVITGGAEYGKPAVQRVLELPAVARE